MSDDFALVDFLLTRARAGDVAQALDRVGARRTPEPRPAKRSGIFSRIFGTAAGAPDSQSTLQIHPEGHLPASPLSRLLPDDLGFGAGETPFRLTTPIGSSGLTLVEFREGNDETSRVAAGLSASLPGEEVFYFRLSGLRHPGAETAFHIYRDGLAIRRSASISASGTTPDSEWRVVDSGLPHAVEADSLPHARARPWEIMTPERQGAILSAMGIEPDTLFEAAPSRVSLDLSAEPGGVGLHEAWRLLEKAGEETVVASDADARDEVDRGEPNEESEGAASAASGGLPAYPYTRAPAPPVAPRRQGARSPPVENDNWEAEVTRLLVRAVAHALPEEEHIPWLTHLTALLESGEVDQALAEARNLIEMGDRSRQERQADIARLSELFDSGR